jgi:hypothetical protein
LTDISVWFDHMIIAKLPIGATTGLIVVNTDNGSTDSASASDYDMWDGTGATAADFVVYDDGPYPPADPGAQCERVAGSWTYDTGWGDVAVYDLTQGDFNWETGVAEISGSVDWSYYYGEDGTCHQDISGTYDRNTGNLLLTAGPDDENGCGRYGEAYRVLNAGCNLTSQAYFWEPDDPYWPPPAADFLDNLTYIGQPMAKTADIPDTETFSFDDWVALPPFGNGATVGEWLQTLSLSSDSSLNFGGRIVYESDPGGGEDNCHFPGSEVPEQAGISGGAWWAGTTSKWGDDKVGAPSKAVDYYRSQGRSGCQFIWPQEMYIHSDTVGPVKYTTNQLVITIDGATVCSAKGPQGGSLNEECTYY